jgi:hypothetical protein
MLAPPEMRQGLLDMNISDRWLRKSCMDNAESLFAEALSEYDAYRGCQDRLEQRVAAMRKKQETDRVQRSLAVMAVIPALPGILAIIAALLMQHLWHSLPYARVQNDGLIALACGMGLGGLAFARVSEWGLVNQSSDTRRLVWVRNAARANLLVALEHAYLLPFIRTKINEERSRSLGEHEFTVAQSAGLSEIHENAYHVPTAIGERLDSVIKGLSGASIGIAGSRGSGKSALLSRYCQDSARNSSSSSGNITCFVAAPVDYAARDFVLYLFATFCRAVLARMEAARLPGSGAASEVWSDRLRRLSPMASSLLLIAVIWAGALALWHFRHNLSPLAGLAQYPVLALIALGYMLLFSEQRQVYQKARLPEPDERIRMAAERSLEKVRFLQTRSSGWTGTANMFGGAGASFSQSATLAEQPLSYPEIVDEFRELVRQVAGYLDREGARIYIGIDELDKIGTAEQAERFLNEIKGIFGIPHTYFLVSVSDDALAAFERRGLPLRDVFDSCFDEIIRAEPLSYQESRRLLYRRVIGLSEPYIALCHCLSGGIPRDLIRAARRVVAIGQDLTAVNPEASEPVRLAAIRSAIICDEIHRKANAAAQVLTGFPNAAEAGDLLQDLYALASAAESGWPSEETISRIAPGPQADADNIAALRVDVAGYLYFCQTLRDVFSDELDEAGMQQATDPARQYPGHFDSLATARVTFASNTLLAWHMISSFRSAWALDRQDAPTTADDRRGYL